MAGLEVEVMEPVAAVFTGVVVGHVVSVAPHPDADRLRVCQVNVRAGRTFADSLWRSQCMCRCQSVVRDGRRKAAWFRY